MDGVYATPPSSKMSGWVDKIQGGKYSFIRQDEDRNH